MEGKKYENFFEASNFCNSYTKIFGTSFIKISRNDRGKYFATSSFSDIFRLLIGITYSIFLFLDVKKKTTQNFDLNRSIIFEIITVANSMVESIHPAFVMVICYHFKFDFFIIRKNIDWIDQKVNF